MTVVMDGREVTASFAIAYVAYHGGTRVLTVDVIRQWCHRGHVRRVGTDLGGYAIYSLNDIVKHCIERGVLVPEQQSCHSVGDGVSLDAAAERHTPR